MEWIIFAIWFGSIMTCVKLAGDENTGRMITWGLLGGLLGPIGAAYCFIQSRKRITAP